MLASAEVGTLITALGCGIGKDEYNPDKLRYHRIILMTDADVDGSHIRTLLLTFFYRQMPELIERGHIYIGLPPLYKIKQGKNELYLKDDAALNAYLVSNAVDGAELRTGRRRAADERRRRWKSCCSTSSPRDEVIARHAYRVDRGGARGAARAAAAVAPRTSRDAARAAPGWRALQARLDDAGLGRAALHARACSRPSDGQGGALRDREAAPRPGQRRRRCRRRSCCSGELRQISEVARAAARPAAARRERRARRPSRSRSRSFREAQAWLLEEAKKGRTIQRFKGLGEMNPEQLWDTTVNPETRRLLKVRIEDAVAADQIFSTLMGDVVEPRREFIEENALRVGNLDV